METKTKTQDAGRQDRGWRVTTYTAIRAGHILTVDTANEWRWYVLPVDNSKGFTCTMSDAQPSLDEAQRAAEAWIDAQVAAVPDLAVYRFAGLEPKVEREREKAADDYALGASDHAFEAAGDR